MTETVISYMLRNKEIEKQYHQRFKQIFHRNLHTYFDLFTGFDLVKFDEEVIEPETVEGESTRDVVFRLHGSEGVDLILSLLGREKTEEHSKVLSELRQQTTHKTLVAAREILWRII